MSISNLILNLNLNLGGGNDDQRLSRPETGGLNVTTPGLPGLTGFPGLAGRRWSPKAA
jgi:hypothetical protein